MVRRQRRVTAPPEVPTVLLGAVFIGPGWTVLIDGVLHVVASKTRVGDGTYVLETDRGPITRRAAEKMHIVATKTTPKYI